MVNGGSGWKSRQLILGSGKRDLILAPPIMNAAGTLGFSDESRGLVDHTRLGAFVTNAVSLSPRRPAHGRRFARIPGGFLLHTGHPNPGLSAVLRMHRSRWASLPCPVIVHLLARTPEEAQTLVERLEGVDEADGVELSLPMTSVEETYEMVSSAAQRLFPLLARLPLDAPVENAQAAQGAGADAVSLGPPRGALPGSGEEAFQGRIYGPSLFPMAYRAAERLSPRVDCPVLVGGGIYREDQIDALLRAGASGVQLDAVLWTEPEAVLGRAAPQEED